MGGDEVNYNCWRQTSSVVEWMIQMGWEVNDEGFRRLWTHFQNNAQQRLYNVGIKTVYVRII
jgi:hexosaminidase